MEGESFVFGFFSCFRLFSGFSDGVVWSIMEWNGVKWCGMEWEGVERAGLGWNGVLWCILVKGVVGSQRRITILKIYAVVSGLSDRERKNTKPQLKH